MESSENNYSILCIGDKYFGVGIFGVKEVIHLPEYTKVPNTHKSIIGVFNLRGEIYSILDFRVLLGQEITPVSTKNLVVILEHENVNYGVIVDKVLDVIEIESANVQTPGRGLPAQYEKYINGMYRDEKIGAVYLIDVAAVSSTEEIASYRY
jgi:chemotaxis signal transduction protein